MAQIQSVAAKFASHRPALEKQQTLWNFMVAQTFASNNYWQPGSRTSFRATPE
jgi:hypothetical protein